jgi:hypothetical protein
MRRAEARRGPGRLVASVSLGILILAGCSPAPDHDPRPTPHATVAAATAPASHRPATAPSAPSRPAPRHTRTRPTPSATIRAPTRGTALALLAGLTVKGRAAQTGYDRDEFGQAWLDTNRNGCDTRGDMLRRDLTGVRFRAGTHDCVVESGTLADPYTATAIHYVRGNDTVDIDHVVALSDAWQTGASGWDIRERAALANDPMNLLAVDSSANRQKGDGDAATWLPSNKGFRCAYSARQVSVKAKYALWVTGPERSAMARILSGCPDQPALTGGAPILSPVGVNKPPSAPTPRRHVGGPVDYENCDAVRAAGADPIHRGDPGYAAHLDRDGDGVGCE